MLADFVDRGGMDELTGSFIEPLPLKQDVHSNKFQSLTQTEATQLRLSLWPADESTTIYSIFAL